MGRYVILVIIEGYQRLISPLVSGRCRYRPTCSDYAKKAIELHGVFRGGLLAVRRMLRCHPWGGQGYDPVPQPREIPEDADEVKENDEVMHSEKQHVQVGAAIQNKGRGIPICGKQL